MKMTPIAFRIDMLNVGKLNYPNLISILGKTNRSLGNYDSLLKTLPNPDILLSAFLNKEAELSSRMEGTQSSFEEIILVDDNDPTLKNNSDLEEVVNYRKAMKFAIQQINADVPLSLGLLKGIHNVLLDGVRGQDKRRGEFRVDQNWIGPTGCKIEEATYIPPIVLEMTQTLSELERYIHTEDIDQLIQTAIIHAKFEMIHPFMDGNGRIGRLLIPLFFYYKSIIKGGPNFYISEVLENNKEMYNNLLLGISKDGKWEDWITFFIESVFKQCERNIERINKIKELYDRTLKTIKENNHSHRTLDIVKFLFIRPAFRADMLADFIKDVSKVTIYDYLKLLESKKIVRTDDKKRGKIYYFPELINIINN